LYSSPATFFRAKTCMWCGNRQTRIVIRESKRDTGGGLRCGPVTLPLGGQVRSGVRDGPCETVARANVVQNSFAQLFEGESGRESQLCAPCSAQRRWERCGCRLRGSGQVAASPRSSIRDAPHHFIQQNFEGRGEDVKPYLATCSALVGRLAADNEPPAGILRMMQGQQISMWMAAVCGQLEKMGSSPHPRANPDTGVGFTRESYLSSLFTTVSPLAQSPGHPTILSS